MNRIEQLIEKYHLHPHPEGGHFAEVYTAPYLYQENRECAGSIYFMLVKNDISHFHVIDCDEIWYFHEGCGMKITMIDEDGNVYINDVLLDEPYLENKDFGDCNIELPYQVPEGKVFVMGDHRSVSVDSRNTAVGCVASEQIVGRIVFRVWPLKRLGTVK